MATPPLGAGQPQAAPRHGVGPSGAHRPCPSAYAKQNLENAARKCSKTTFQPDKDTKKIRLDEAHPDRVAVIGTGLDPK